MREILEEEYNQFLHDMKDGALTFGRYVDVDDYEDEYSHNEIEDCQEKFIDKVSDYLRENCPGKYVVTSAWCVFVMTAKEAQERNLRHYEDYLIR